MTNCLWCFFFLLFFLLSLVAVLLVSQHMLGWWVSVAKRSNSTARRNPHATRQRTMKSASHCACVKKRTLQGRKKRNQGLCSIKPKSREMLARYLGSHFWKHDIWFCTAPKIGSPPPLLSSLFFLLSFLFCPLSSPCPVNSQSQLNPVPSCLKRLVRTFMVYFSLRSASSTAYRVCHARPSSSI